MKQLIIYDTETGAIVACPAKGGEASPIIEGSGNITGDLLVSDEIIGMDVEDIHKMNATLSNGRSIIFTGIQGLGLYRAEGDPSNTLRLTRHLGRIEEEGDFTYYINPPITEAQHFTAAEQAFILEEIGPSYPGITLASYSIDFVDNIDARFYYVDIADNNNLKLRTNTITYG